MLPLLAAVTLSLLAGCSGSSDEASYELAEGQDPTEATDQDLSLDVYPSDYSHAELTPQSFTISGGGQGLALFVDTPIVLVGDLTGFQPNQRSAIANVPGGTAGLAAEIAAEVPDTPMAAGLTTEDGSFELRLLPGQGYELAFMPAVDEEIPFLVLHDASFDVDGRLDTYIDYGVPVYGLVTDADGAAMAGVEVQLVDPVSGLAGQAVVTDEVGAWSLRALDGAWTLRLDGGTARPWLPTQERSLQIDDDSEGARVDVAFGLGEPLRATGRVVDDDGSPLDDVKVRLTSTALSDTAGRLVAETETDGNGSFTARVVAGTYEVELIPDYQGSEGPRLLEQTWTLNDHDDLGQLFLEARPTAEGVVTSPSGEPLQNAVVQAAELGFDGYIYEARTDASGTFRVDAAEGELRWTVHPPEDVDAALTHFQLSTDDVGQLPLVQGDALSGCVDSDAGELAYTPIDVRRGDEVLATTTTDEAGCFEVRIEP